MNKYLKAANLFGVLGGLFCGLAFLVVYFLKNEPVGFTEIFGYFLVPVFVFFGIKNFKDNTNGGELFFSQGMTVGFFVYSILAFISGMVIFIFLYLDPVIFENYRGANLALLEEKKEVIIEQLNEESYKSTYENILNMTKFDVAFNDFLRKVLPGLFFTIIISIALKTTKNLDYGDPSKALSSGR